MLGFDENSYSTSAFSIRSYSLGEVITAFWKPVLRFKLRVVTKFSLDLKVRR